MEKAISVGPPQRRWLCGRWQRSTEEELFLQSEERTWT